MLFLDEPTIGLDPQTRAHIWEYIYDLRKKENITIFLTTHYMEEAEFCDNIAIIDSGKIIAMNTPKNLKKLVSGDIILLKTLNNEKIKTQLADDFNLHVKKFNDYLRIVTDESSKLLPVLFRKLGKKIIEIDIKKSSLDDVFIKLTGKQIREEKTSKRERMKIS